MCGESANTARASASFVRRATHAAIIHGTLNAQPYAKHHRRGMNVYSYFLTFWAGGVCGYGLCLFIWRRSVSRATLSDNPER
jgi:hypothetical protein